MAFDAPLAEEIWSAKYRFSTPDHTTENTIEATWRRVAKALAAPEEETLRAEHARHFNAALRDFRFLPGGRILAGAGTGRSVTLFNCFVMGTIPDTLDGIFAQLREAALTMQQGGGVGMDFSTIRPKGAPVHGVGAEASGPLSFMDAWDAMCRTVMSAGARRGAMMGCLRIDHPDIEAFIDAKRDPAKLRNFNLSVLVTDAFMAALRADADWPLTFDGVVFRIVKAGVIWEKLMRATYDGAEPGVIFIDRINALNTLADIETIAATNPCGEQPLPPYGACLLGAINLARLVKAPFTDNAHIDPDDLAALVAVAVRMLDNVIDLSKYPLPQQAEEAMSKRRIGLGVTGLADALIFCRTRYGDEAAIARTNQWLGVIKRAAYRASAHLAKDKGAFPLWHKGLLEKPNLKGLDAETKALIRAHGLRNACLTTIAPTGTTSLIAGNVSSGIEPVFAFSYTRKVRQADGSTKEEPVEDYALQVWRKLHADAPMDNDYFVSAQTLQPDDHLRMQAAAQAHIDSAISKTVNCAEAIPFTDFSDIYLKAYDLGCKGCTTYRPNPITGSILTSPAPKSEKAAPPPLPKRPARLHGATTKIKWPDSEHALYVTINDAEDQGEQRPFEIFLNSKNMEHYAWSLALTRMISAVFRRGGDVRFVAEELKAVFDPRGGAWIEGRYVPSVLAAIGEVIQRHLDNPHADTDRLHPDHSPTSGAMTTPRACPKCGAAALLRKEGCDTCLECGYSKCG